MSWVKLLRTENDKKGLVCFGVFTHFLNYSFRIFDTIVKELGEDKKSAQKVFILTIKKVFGDLKNIHQKTSLSISLSQKFLVTTQNQFWPWKWLFLSKVTGKIPSDEENIRTNYIKQQQVLLTVKDFARLYCKTNS